MNILVAPDSFKDALSAPAAAAAIASGIQTACSDAHLDLCPLGDGGEGTGALLAEPLGAVERRRTVLGPRGRPRQARWWLRDAQPALSIVEMAEAAGLALLAPHERDAARTTSYGVGQLLQAAFDSGAARVLLCVGGSATVDGGSGCLQALGGRLLDARGAPIQGPMSGGRLAAVHRVIPPPARPAVRVDVLCDVRNPLLGRDGAARVFAPQKGADDATVARLESALERWAALLRAATGVDVRTIPGGGAAGGLPAGLHAALGARLLPGFDEVADALRLRERIARADLVITGEGRFDAQTSAGKVVSGVARLARAAGRPVIVLAGSVADDFETARALADAREAMKVHIITPADVPLAEALAATGENLQAAATEAMLGCGWSR